MTHEQRLCEAGGTFSSSRSSGSRAAASPRRPNICHQVGGFIQQSRKPGGEQLPLTAKVTHLWQCQGLRLQRAADVDHFCRHVHTIKKKMRSLFASKGWVWKTKQFTDSNQSPSDDLISVHRASDTGRFSASQQLQNKIKLLWVSAVSQFCLWTSSADGCGRRTSIQERKSGDSVHREPECVYTGMYFLETI